MFDQGGNTPLTEADSRPIPYTRAEFDWAHSRESRHWVPVPTEGDTVLYRHDPWATPTEATVEWVQPADDIDDPHLWVVQTDERGGVLLHHGQPVMAPKPDPWPVLRLKTRFGPVETREARLRGAPGWLPIDWQARWRPVPHVSGPVGLPLFVQPGAEPAPAPGPMGG